MGTITLQRTCVLSCALTILRNGSRASKTKRSFRGFLLAAVLSQLPGWGAEFYTSPSAGAGGDGSFNRPFTLAKALASSALKGGDTLWLRGGTYSGSFVSRLHGEPGSPITIRSYQNEAAKLAGSDAGAAALSLTEPWVVIQDLDVSNRILAGVLNGTAVAVRASHIKIINSVFHDAAIGVEITSGAEDTLVYGNLIFGCGRITGGDSSAGVLIREDAKQVWVANNVVFKQVGSGIVVADSTDADARAITIDQNILFDNGVGSLLGSTGNLRLLGARLSGITITSNHAFDTDSWIGGENILASSDCANLNIQNNYFTGRIAMLVSPCTGLILKGNTVLGGLLGSIGKLFPRNRILQSAPATPRVLITRNAYEAGRGHLLLETWSEKKSMLVDLSVIVPAGKPFELRSVADPYGKPLVTGTFDGKAVTVPLDPATLLSSHRSGVYLVQVVTESPVTVKTASAMAMDASAPEPERRTAQVEPEYLSDSTATSTSNAWGPTEKDRSNGEIDPGDGEPLTIGGVVFKKGLGAHANSESRYAVKGCTSFTVNVGIDDEVGSQGSVAFQIWVDGKTVFETDVLRGSDPPKQATVSLTGAEELRLVAINGGDDINWDHADWADTRLQCGDGVPPEITGKSPAAGASVNAADVSITVTFSEAVDPATVSANTLSLIDVASNATVASSVAYNPNTRTGSIDPAASLREGVTYSVKVKGGDRGVKDIAGNALASDYTWSFAVRDSTAPTVTATNPAANATAVPREAAIVATFSEAIQSSTCTTATVTLVSQADGSAIPVTIAYDGASRSVTLTPASALLSNSLYTATIKTGVKDLAGNPFAKEFAWRFRTKDDEPPTVAASTPPNGTKGVNAQPVIKVSFSEPVQGSTLNTSTVSLMQQSNKSAVAVTLVIETSAVTIKPSAPLASSTIYQVIVKGGSSGVKDIAGNAMATDFTASFTTADSTPPRVVGINPAASAKDVAIKATIRARFSEALQEASIKPSAVTLVNQASSTSVSVSLAYDKSSFTVTMTPASLEPGTTYRVTLLGKTGVKDAAGNPLAANYSWTFTTAPAEPKATAYPLGSLAWSSSSNGWGPVERDRSNGEAAAGDGGVITLNKTTYATGLGAHAPSEIRYTLSGCTAFSTTMGVDDEVGDRGSVTFEIWLDGAKKYDSGLMTGSTTAKSANLSLAGVSELRLVITNGGGDNGYDHGDWAGASVSCTGSQTARSQTSGAVDITPGTDIQAVVDQYPEGTKFYLRAGVHRLQAIVPKNGNIFTGESGAILNGARLLTQFQKEGDLWYAAGQIQQLGNTAGSCDTAHPRCRNQEDFFFDDVPLLHVGQKSNLGPGKYYFDYDNDRIYFADNPAGRKVETSVTEYAFRSYSSNVTIQGLTIEKYANPAQTGAIQPGLNWVIKSNTVRRNHGGGIDLNSNVQVLSNTVTYNGQIGIHGAGRDILVDGNEIAYNNQLGFDYGWEAGGTKFAFCENLTVSNNRVHDNKGPGLWTDINNYKVLYDGNRVWNNVIGIFHEISYDAVIRNNTVETNGLMLPANQRELWWTAGILIASSSNVEVYNNTLRGNVNGIGAIQNNRGTGNRGDHETRNLNIHDNSTEQSTGMAAGIMSSPEYDAVYRDWNNRYSGNQYVAPKADQSVYGWAGKLLNRAGWQDCKQDTNGKWGTR